MSKDFLFSDGIAFVHVGIRFIFVTEARFADVAGGQILDKIWRGVWLFGLFSKHNA